MSEPQQYWYCPHCVRAVELPEIAFSQAGATHDTGCRRGVELYTRKQSLPSQTVAHDGETPRVDELASRSWIKAGSDQLGTLYELARTLERERDLFERHTLDYQTRYYAERALRKRIEADLGNYGPERLKAAVLAERQACALVCERRCPAGAGTQLGPHHNDRSREARDCAAAIRARKEGQ